MMFKFNISNEITFQYNITALYTAAENGNYEIVRLLLSNYKIDPNIINVIIYHYFYNLA